MQCEIASTCEIDFTKDNCNGEKLGFSKRKLEPFKLHTWDFPVNILKVNATQINCNTVNDAYRNGEPVHILHEFYPAVPPGYKIVETPRNVIYSSVNFELTQRNIANL